MALTISRVNVTTAAAVALWTAQATSPDAITITNDGPNSIYLGNTSGVTAATGLVVLKQTTYTIPAAVAKDMTTLFAIAATADQSSPANTSVAQQQRG